MVVEACRILPRLLVATAPARSMSSCVFCKIVAREVETSVLHEDDRFLVFPDISPAATHHFLVIPKVVVV